MILNSINIFISQPLFFANPHTQCNAYQIDVKIAEFQQFFSEGGLDFCGIFQKTRVWNDVRKRGIKFG